MTEKQRIDDISAELATGHPDTGPYSSDDRTAADQMNEINRPSEGTTQEILKYFLQNTHKSDEGTDTRTAYLYGRLALMARSKEGEDPYKRGLPVTIEQISSAINIDRAMLSGESAVNFSSSVLDDVLINLRQAATISPQQRNEIMALQNNTQSRGNEIGVGRVRTGDIERARLVSPGAVSGKNNVK